MKRVGMILVCAVGLYGADLAGPQSCRPCHADKVALQSASHHAKALRAVSETALPGLLADRPLRERSGIEFQYGFEEGKFSVRIARGDRSVTAPLVWAFGSGAQAITPVGEYRGRYFEHRISYYESAHGARRTLGHPGEASQDPASALGIPQDSATIFRCFGCHATGVKPGLDLSGMIPGVTCERCHGPAMAHVSGEPIRKPTRTQQAVMQLCGECHRLSAGPHSSEPEVSDPMSIRFAPVGLSASQCFRRSSTLSCISCHDPHANASHESATYNQVCQGCHKGQNVCKAGRVTDCVSCHMPKRSPAPYLTFTDHRIRIYRN